MSEETGCTCKIVEGYVGQGRTSCFIHQCALCQRAPELLRENERLRAVIEPGTMEARMEYVWTVAIKYGHSAVSSKDAIVFLDELVAEQRAENERLREDNSFLHNALHADKLDAETQRAELLRENEILRALATVRIKENAELLQENERLKAITPAILPGTFVRCLASGHYYACVRGDEECPHCARVAELLRERDALARLKDPVEVRIGNGALTRDLVWCCGCGRGLALSGKWMYCPTCGRPIDQQSYAAKVEAARSNGSTYKDPETTELIIKLRDELDALRAVMDTMLNALHIVQRVWKHSSRGKEALDAVRAAISDAEKLKEPAK